MAHDPHVIKKQRDGGTRHGEVTFYAVGWQRSTRSQARKDLHRFLAGESVDLACQEGLSEQVADLQATVARLEGERDRALAEGAGLREALERIGHGSAPGIDEDEGWLRAAIIARSALASSPLSELAGEVLEAAVEKRRSAQAFSKTQVGRVDRKAEREAFDRRGRAERRYEKCLSAYMAELAWEGGEGG